MVFSSNVFLTIFFPTLLICYNLPIVRKKNLKNTVLLVFSIIFYMWGEPIFIFVLLSEIIINWVLTLQLDKKEKKSRKVIMAFLVSLDVLILFVFKYLVFLTNNIFSIIHVDKPVMEIALPIGISFFSFQIISYVIDVYRKEVPASKSFSKLMLYVIMFPQLIAGPIVRYKTIQHEIDGRIEYTGEWREGFVRFSYGLGKKVLIANYAGTVVDSIFQTASLQPLSVLSAVYGSLMYTFQIYFDFSGYSDMAIGLGKMFGFHFPENFNYPYMAGTITEFWRRWHMTLSSWFRDYIYIPGGVIAVPGQNKFGICLQCGF